MPRISEEFARRMVAKDVKMLGVESPSVTDVNNLPEVSLIHEILLIGNVTIVEGLTNLDQLKSTRVLFGAMPLTLAPSDGAPVRAFAIEGVSPDILN
jgi:arylformamidase